MKRSIALTFISCALLSLGVLGQSYAGSITMLNPSQIQWKDGPKSLPKGFQYAILAGNPSKPGLFTMRLKIPANYRVPAHYHSSMENITVISGSLHLTYGKKLNKSKLFKAGSFISIPPKVKHFAWTTRGKTVVQLNNMGPWKMNYTDPKTDPRKR